MIHVPPLYCYRKISKDSSYLERLPHSSAAGIGLVCSRRFHESLAGRSLFQHVLGKHDAAFLGRFQSFFEYLMAGSARGRVLGVSECLRRNYANYHELLIEIDPNPLCFPLNDAGAFSLLMVRVGTRLHAGRRHFREPRSFRSSSLAPHRCPSSFLRITRDYATDGKCCFVCTCRRDLVQHSATYSHLLSLLWQDSLSQSLSPPLPLPPSPFFPPAPAFPHISLLFSLSLPPSPSLSPAPQL